jgi:hypothetical protein
MSLAQKTRHSGFALRSPAMPRGRAPNATWSGFPEVSPSTTPMALTRNSSSVCRRWPGAKGGGVSVGLTHERWGKFDPNV